MLDLITNITLFTYLLTNVELLALGRNANTFVLMIEIITIGTLITYSIPKLITIRVRESTFSIYNALIVLVENVTIIA